MDAGIVELVAQTGGTLGLAVFAIFMLNRVWGLRLEESKRNAEVERCHSNQVQKALESSTLAINNLTKLVERIEHILERER